MIINAKYYALFRFMRRFIDAIKPRLMLIKVTKGTQTHKFCCIIIVRNFERNNETLELLIKY